MKKQRLFILIGVLCGLFMGCSLSGPESELHTVAIEYSDGSKDTLELKLFTGRISKDNNYNLVVTDMAYPYLCYDNGGGGEDYGEIYNVVRAEILK